MIKADRRRLVGSDAQLELGGDVSFQGLKGTDEFLLRLACYYPDDEMIPRLLRREGRVREPPVGCYHD